MPKKMDQRVLDANVHAIRIAFEAGWDRGFCEKPLIVPRKEAVQIAWNEWLDSFQKKGKQ